MSPELTSFRVRVCVCFGIFSPHFLLQLNVESLVNFSLSLLFEIIKDPALCHSVIPSDNYVFHLCTYFMKTPYKVRQTEREKPGCTFVLSIDSTKPLWSLMMDRAGFKRRKGKQKTQNKRRIENALKRFLFLFVCLLFIETHSGRFTMRITYKVARRGVDLLSRESVRARA